MNEIIRTQDFFREFENELKQLKYSSQDNQEIVTWVDQSGFEILRGYGGTSVEALNDLHRNLYKFIIKIL